MSNRTTTATCGCDELRIEIAVLESAVAESIESSFRSNVAHTIACKERIRHLTDRLCA